VLYNIIYDENNTRVVGNETDLAWFRWGGCLNMDTLATPLHERDRLVLSLVLRACPEAKPNGNKGAVKYQAPT
jgi:hypothetical protein